MLPALAAVVPVAPANAQTEFESLFDRTSLAGWTTAGEAAWSVADGTVSADAGPTIFLVDRRRGSGFTGPKAGGRWNTMIITAREDAFSVTLNGRRTVEAGRDASHREGPFAEICMLFRTFAKIFCPKNDYIFRTALEGNRQAGRQVLGATRMVRNNIRYAVRFISTESEMPRDIRQRIRTHHDGIFNALMPVAAYYRPPRHVTRSSRFADAEVADMRAAGALSFG